MKKVILWLIIGIISLSGFSAHGMGKVIPKKTPMQNVGDGAYCWTPDGKIAFYRRIDHWIKYEPDPFPGGGGVYDDYKKNDEGFIVVRDPNTKEEKVLFKVPFKGAAPGIKYMDWSGANEKILLSSGVLETINPDGSDFKMIVHKEGGYCSHATWSPDGKQILYSFLPHSLMDERIAQMVAKGLRPGLYIVNANGSSDKFLIEGENGSWSPDGKQIVYQELRKYMIYIINADGTGKRLLLEGGANPAWSPDGKWILYYYYGRPGGWYIISPDGNERKKLKPPINSPPRWSSDGKKILGDRGFIAEVRVKEENKSYEKQ